MNSDYQGEIIYHTYYNELGLIRAFYSKRIFQTFDVNHILIYIELSLWVSVQGCELWHQRAMSLRSVHPYHGIAQSIYFNLYPSRLCCNDTNISYLVLKIIT